MRSEGDSEMATQDTPLLEASGVTVRFGKVTALDDRFPVSEAIYERAAAAGAAARFDPKIEKIEPGAMACPGTKLAPFTMPPTLG